MGTTSNDRSKANNYNTNITRTTTTPAKKSKTESQNIITEIERPKDVSEENNTSIKDAKPTKISSYDYSAWDKFDVEAACEEVENEVEEDSSEEEELENERLRQEAVAEKDRGNQFFKAGNWDQAIEKYTRGMQLDPMNCVLPANRAMALLKKEQFGAAESDCTLALSLDKTYVKAFQRRGTARVGLGKLDLALDDFKQVIKLEPTNKAATLEIDKIEKKLVANKAKGSPEKAKVTEKATSGKEETKKFDERMKGAFLKKSSETSDSDVKLSSVKITKFNSQEKPQSNVISETNANEEGRVFPIKKPNHLRSQKPLKRIQIVDVDNSFSKDIVKESVVSNSINTETVITSQPAKDSKSVGFVKKIENEISSEISKVDLVETIPEVAKTSSKFLTDWKSLRTVVNRSKYLRQFRETDYRTVFKSSLDGQLFSEMILVLHHLVQRGADPDIVVQQLRGLSGLPRVSAVAMFMSSQDQEKMRYLIGELECVEKTEKEKWIKTFSL